MADFTTDPELVIMGQDEKWCILRVVRNRTGKFKGKWCAVWDVFKSSLERRE